MTQILKCTGPELAKSLARRIVSVFLKTLRGSDGAPRVFHHAFVAIMRDFFQSLLHGDATAAAAAAATTGRSHRTAAAASTGTDHADDGVLTSGSCFRHEGFT